MAPPYSTASRFGQSAAAWLVGTRRNPYNQNMRFSSLSAVVAIIAVLGAIAAGSADAASIREQQSALAWHKQDVCAHEAFIKFPDFTPDSNIRRARATRDCERRNHVLQRPPVTASPVKRIPDSAAE